jgi:hypothetical protein
MVSTYITDMLKMAFGDGSTTTRFGYLALGGSDSNGVSNQSAKSFAELSGDGYERVALSTDTSVTKGIKLTATFNESNYAPVNGGTIKEIAIINNKDKSSNDVIFGIAEVPEIIKKDNISISYDILIEIE